MNLQETQEDRIWYDTSQRMFSFIFLQTEKTTIGQPELYRSQPDIMQFNFYLDRDLHHNQWHCNQWEENDQLIYLLIGIIVVHADTHVNTQHIDIKSLKRNILMVFTFHSRSLEDEIEMKKTSST